MKIGYYSPRPYMTFDGLTTIGCSHEYGNPSGHSLFSAGFSLFVFLDFFSHQSGGEKSRAYNTCLIAAIAFFVLMGFARVYQAVHSVDQVLYGWQLGIWGALYFNYCLRDWLISHVNYGIKDGSA